MNDEEDGSMKEGNNRKIKQPSSEVKQKIVQHFIKYALPKRVFEEQKKNSQEAKP
jgi:hypothetical protein